MKKIKNILKHIIPPSYLCFEHKIICLKDYMQGQFEFQNSQLSILMDNNRQLSTNLEMIFQKNLEILNYVSSMGKDIETLVKTLNDTKEVHQKQLDNLIQIQTNNIKTSRLINELLWGEIFNSSIINSKWLIDKTFAPGRWAVGYSYLYVMYRVLNELKPKSIIELGLGQSTRMISQYAHMHSDIEHIVVEHDQSWIDFFCQDFLPSERTQIIRLDLELADHNEAKSVRSYKGFKELFLGKKFDFILIDAPQGGDMKQYSRIDLLSIFPECLKDSFVIAIDDCQRSGERHTVQEMEDILKARNILYVKGKYGGSKDSIFLCSEDLSFVSTM
jgi:ABC-type oligopeptide transport system ATPase subunit